MGIQLIIGFLDLFKGSLGKNSGRLVLRLGAEHIGHGYLFGFLPRQLVLIICLV